MIQDKATPLKGRYRLSRKASFNFQPLSLLSGLQRWNNSSSESPVMLSFTSKPSPGISPEEPGLTGISLISSPTENLITPIRRSTFGSTESLASDYLRNLPSDKTQPNSSSQNCVDENQESRKRETYFGFEFDVHSRRGTFSHPRRNKCSPSDEFKRTPFENSWMIRQANSKLDSYATLRRPMKRRSALSAVVVRKSWELEDWELEARSVARMKTASSEGVRNIPSSPNSTHETILWPESDGKINVSRKVRNLAFLIDVIVIDS